MGKALRKQRKASTVKQEVVSLGSDAVTHRKVRKKLKTRQRLDLRTAGGGDPHAVKPIKDEKLVQAGRPRKKKKLGTKTAAPQARDASDEKTFPKPVTAPPRKRNKGLRTKHAAVQEICAAETFEELEADLGQPLLKALRQHGYLTPTPVQAQSIPIALRGQDVIAVASTGSGKTCAYVLPALVHVSVRATRSPPRTPWNANVSKGNSPPAGSWTCPKCGNINWPKRVSCNTRSCGAPRPGDLQAVATTSEPSVSRPATPSVLILCPTRELAQQIHAETCKFTAVKSARALCIYGGVPKGEQAGALTSQGADVVVATPGRCLDFLEKDKFLGQPLSVSNVTCLVLDEADRMLEAGFLPAILSIVGMCPKSRNQEALNQSASTGDVNRNTDLLRQTLFFTATWPVAVQDAAHRVVAGSAVEVRVAQRRSGQLAASKSVEQSVEVMSAHGAKLERVNEVLKRDLHGGTTIIFCKTQKRCEWLGKKIQLAHPFAWIRSLHAGKDQQEREDTMALFRDITAKGAKQKGILVATNVAARGIDVPGVRLVVVYDFSTVEDYVHQIGRTGRAGAQGEAVTFYVAGDGDARDFVEILRQAGQTVPTELVAIADSETAALSSETNSLACEDPMRPSCVQQGWKDAKWRRTRGRRS